MCNSSKTMSNVVSNDLLKYIHIFANRSIRIQTQQKSLLPYLGLGVLIYTNTTSTKITLEKKLPFVCVLLVTLDLPLDASLRVEQEMHRHETLTQFWGNDGTASTGPTLSQGQCLVFVGLPPYSPRSGSSALFSLLRDPLVWCLHPWRY